jgi:hypothetical protein
VREERVEQELLNFEQNVVLVGHCGIPLGDRDE